MSKLTKFKVRRSQFPLDFRIDNTTRDTNIKTLTAMPGTVFEEGTEETAETYNGLQLGLVHSVTPVKSVANSIDYYTCDIEGIADFGMHNELKLQVKITATNEYNYPKIKMAGNDYQIMRFDGVQLTQVLTGQLKTDNIYNLSFNGTLFILSSGMIAEKEVKALLDTTDFQATETINGVSKLATQPEVDNGLEDTKIVTAKTLAEKKVYRSIVTNDYTQTYADVFEELIKQRDEYRVKIKRSGSYLISGFSFNYFYGSTTPSEQPKYASIILEKNGTVICGARSSNMTGLTNAGVTLPATILDLVPGDIVRIKAHGSAYGLEYSYHIIKM